MKEFNEALEHFALGSVIPQRVSETGSTDEPLIEAIVCDSISGGADYIKNMPHKLSLIRRTIDGQEYRANYIQDRRTEVDQCTSIRRFADERLEIDAASKLDNQELYAAYKEFCTANGEYLRSHRRLSQEMYDRGFSQRVLYNRCWLGVRLKDRPAQTTD